MRHFNAKVGAKTVGETASDHSETGTRNKRNDLVEFTETDLVINTFSKK